MKLRDEDLYIESDVGMELFEDNGSGLMYRRTKRDRLYMSNIWPEPWYGGILSKLESRPNIKLLKISKPSKKFVTDISLSIRDNMLHRDMMMLFKETFSINESAEISCQWKLDDDAKLFIEIYNRLLPAIHVLG